MTSRTIFTCDRCGCDLDGKAYDDVAKFELRRGSTMAASLDLCDPCASAVEEFAQGSIVSLLWFSCGGVQIRRTKIDEWLVKGRKRGEVPAWSRLHSSLGDAHADFHAHCGDSAVVIPALPVTGV